jgi:LysM repeat protein
MSRKYLALCLFPFIISSLSAKGAVECRVATGGMSKCNPYSSRLLIAKEIEYQKDETKLIVDKTLPVPKKTSVKVISVVDMIEKYVKIEKPIRYEGSKERQLETLNIESAKDDNVHSLSKELEIRRASTLAKLQKMEEEAYSKRVKETVCVPSTEVVQKIKPAEKEKEEVQVESSYTVENGDILEKLQKMEEEAYSKRVKETVSVPGIEVAGKIKEPEEEKLEPKVEGIYTVGSGDTLSTIARKFRLKTAELRELNQLKKGESLKIGKKLIIPMDQEMVDIIAKAEYTIQPGDNIGSIAQDFNLSSKDILKYNQLKKDSVICIGKKLVLPFPYKIAQLEKERKAREAKKKAKAKKSRMVRGFGKRKLRVTATAYSSHHGQTDKTPFLAAWNNRIRPGMKIIAVSRDMLTRYGLRNGSKVRIGGLPGFYTVRDKMNKRYRKRIDIYMGTNRRRALRWGRRSVMLYY